MVGQRYKVPGEEFDDDSDDDEGNPDWFYGVVTHVQKTGCKMLFDGDETHTRYDGFLETWNCFLVTGDMLDEDEEAIFQEIEKKAKLRAVGRRLNQRRSTQLDEDDSEGSDSQGADNDEVVEVETWESDQEDDESPIDPELAADEATTDERLSIQEYNRAQWVDVGRLDTDPRAQANAMPEDVTPAFLMPSFREESLLNWFLWWMPLGMLTSICHATNENAKNIPWPDNQPWKHLVVGELLRWIGLWILMTVYPIPAGGRRNYWRGIFKFHQYMEEKRFENILRAFCLPQYKKEAAGWGGPAREHYRQKKYDKFQETRRFTDEMRVRFQDAMKPSGWLCIDESMFSWLGRALKCPGWKVIKRKPHPIGLEAKTTACPITSVLVLVDFEFQEGTKPMGYFQYVGDTNRSTAWLLRLTKKWHNKEQRTVIADAAFAQVRAAVALKRIGGLFFIGNVKTCTKYFCKAALKAECAQYERNRLVVLSKKITLGSGMDKVNVFGTGWRCTGDMVVTYVHTGGTNVMGSDRIKRKYTQMSDGKVNVENYHVKRPKVSSEYQNQMGAIDAHNYRRQSCKSVTSFEKYV